MIGRNLKAANIPRELSAVLRIERKSFPADAEWLRSYLAVLE